MKEIRVESEINGDWCTAEEKGTGIRILGGWLERGKALEFAKKLVDALMKEE